VIPPAARALKVKPAVTPAAPFKKSLLLGESFIVSSSPIIFSSLQYRFTIFGIQNTVHSFSVKAMIIAGRTIGKSNSGIVTTLYVYGEISHTAIGIRSGISRPHWHEKRELR
jgi:hypothetical protein